MRFALSETIETMDSETFYELLRTFYGGDVVAAENFISPQATILFHCVVCGSSFFNRPDYLLESNQHKCFFRYADVTGQRRPDPTKDKIVKRLSKKTKAEILALYKKGLPPKWIAAKLGLTVGTVVNLLKIEGNYK